MTKPNCKYFIIISYYYSETPLNHSLHLYTVFLSILNIVCGPKSTYAYTNNSCKPECP